MTMAPARLSALIYAVAFCGGAAALAVEVVWARMLQRALGSTSLGVAVAAASVLAGLGLGAYAGERLLPRAGRPLKALGGMEIAGAAAAIAFTLLAARGFGVLLALPRGEAAVGILAAAAALPWGASFPLAVAALPAEGGFRRRVRALYGWNALGAAGGGALAGLAGVPAIGEWGTVGCAAALEASLGAALVIVAGLPAGRVAAVEPRAAALPETAGGLEVSPRLWAAFLFLTGLAVMYWEMLWTRILVLTVGGTVHAFSLMLASVILGIGAGSLLLPGRSVGHALWALPATAAVCLAGGYAAVPYLPDAYLAGVRWLGASPLVVGSLGAAAVAFLPNFLLGSLFPRAVAARAARAGSAFAVNAAGSIAGALLGGPAGARLWSLEGSYRVGVGTVAALALLGACLARAPRGIAGALAAALAAAAISVGPLSVPWDPMRLVSGVYQWSVEDLESLPLEETFRSREIIALVPGREAIVTVEIDRAANTVYVRGNGKVEGSVPADRDRPSRADMPTQVLLGALPAALHRRAPGAEALLIGLGSGVTLGALADPEAGFAPGAIDAIEVEEAYAEAMRSEAARPYFEPFVPESLLRPPGGEGSGDALRLHFGDARRLLATGLRGRRWDAIVSQPSEPWIPGAAPLFTVEFLEAAAERLKPGGAFFQWLQIYKLDIESARLFTRTFRRVFPRVFLLRPHPTGEVILIGSRDEVPIERLLDAPAGRWAKLAGLESPADIPALFLAGPEGIDRWVGLEPGLPVNTDSRSEIQYRATRSLYSSRGLTLENLEALRGIAARDPVSRYLPLALRGDAAFLRLLAARNIRVGDLGEALAILEGDEGEEAGRLRAEIEKRSAAPAGRPAPPEGGGR